MRIVIDLQGAQTESRFRGIGRYSLSLAQSIALNRGEHEIFIALNGLFPDTIEPIRAAFDELLPQENIRVWFAPGPVCESAVGNEWRRQTTELIREAFLASLKPDVVYITSLFEGFVDDAVTSIGLFDLTAPVVVTLYDLIPLLNADKYLTSNPAYEKYYHQKIEHLHRASMLMSISDASRLEGIEYLDLPITSIINVSTAADESFRVVSLSDSQKSDLYKKFNIARDFILHTGGADERKNIPCLIRAYGKLTPAMRKKYQLVLAGKMSEGQINILKHEISKSGLNLDDVVFIGYVSNEELVLLYNLCDLYVFPSWHEGFGLPALEAMACGVAVIGSNTSSLPEVIGREDALFDPYSVESISRKISEVLTKDKFREDLINHGLEQAKKFSWSECARRAMVAFEQVCSDSQREPSVKAQISSRLRLALVSPMPPERSGIANYSAELLPALGRYYDIDVVVAQDGVTDEWVQANWSIRNPDWLIANAHSVDRVLYQFGNSPFHWYMLDLLNVVPGTVVMHDFFLSSFFSSLEKHGNTLHVWSRALYHSHGYTALWKRFHERNVDSVIFEYPANLEVFQQANGSIVHSEYSRKLTDEWYGKDFANELKVIPLLRTHQTVVDQEFARHKLGFKKNDFVVCSFGFLDPTKHNHRLINAWLKSKLVTDERCVLVFVGENHGGDYGKQLLSTIRENKIKKCIRITGWVDKSTYQSYLEAADVAVQLRAQSRGETSAAVLDCMNYGLATIVNANGSMADLPTDVVWMIPDDFSESQLIEAMENLRDRKGRRISLGDQARVFIQANHGPSVCAEQYAKALEHFYANEQTGYSGLINAIARMDNDNHTDGDYIALSKAISQSLPLKQPVRQLLLDITATNKSDLKTGIERVARALTLALLQNPPTGFRVEPVYLCNEGGIWFYRYARSYTLGLLECPSCELIDEQVDPQNGDIVVTMDLSGQKVIDANASGLFSHYRRIGVVIFSIVYDLLPVASPEFFPRGAKISHEKWLQTISNFNGAICISSSVAGELEKWMELNRGTQLSPYKVGYIHLGADVENSAPTFGLPENATDVLGLLAMRPSFLMVGTIEPRKGYLQTLKEFTQLWEQGQDINLVIVGREGWRGLPDEMRRTIPEIVNSLRQHAEMGRHLFWLEEVSDEYLEKIYAVSSCLIAASEGEGFGLPLIEAAQHKLPIIARDTPVFREVAGEYAYYFDSSCGYSLGHEIVEWLALYVAGCHPQSNGLRIQTWEESARSLVSVITGKENFYMKPSTSVRNLALNGRLRENLDK